MIDQLRAPGRLFIPVESEDNGGTPGRLVSPGGTGGQYIWVVDKKEDGSPSRYAVRALTRDSNSCRAKELAEKGAELFQGASICR